MWEALPGAGNPEQGNEQRVSTCCAPAPFLGVRSLLSRLLKNMTHSKQHIFTQAFSTHTTHSHVYNWNKSIPQLLLTMSNIR